ncbi:MAG: thioredoxin-dependent thiol peroxidase [Euryarchaeota archaeon]|nr:thioredoxin-dependent thiol peroxidase [Euryarchaeota archaeon]
MADNTELQIGDVAPEFTAFDSEGNSISLKELTSEGKYVILYFYPKDSTPGCTIQACDFRDSMETLKSNNVVVLGVSKDSEKSHQNFIKKQSLNFPLLLDEDLHIHNKYGVWKEKSMYGKTYMGTARSTFVIGPDGMLKFVNYKVKAKGHVETLLEEGWFVVVN